jgi:hypothetical protein
MDIVFTSIFRADYNLVMLAAVEIKMFWRLVCCLLVCQFERRTLAEGKK